MTQDRQKLNPLTFFSSIFFLGFLFFIYLSLRPVPADPEAYVYLSNLRAVTESGSFFGLEEPFSVLILYFWKSFLHLNYLTAFQSLASILFSLSLHLVLLFFRKGDWKLNHYFLVYFSAFLPFSHEFPVVYFNELVGLLFLLLVFHTFRMENILDLLLFPILVLAIFFADLRIFLLGFSLFVWIETWKASNRIKAKTTVFYKRKNIPMIISLVYSVSLVVFLVLASWYDFFSPSSFWDLLVHWGTVVFFLLPAVVAILLGNLLLDTEKELRTKTFTIILVAAMLGIVVFNYSRYNTELQDNLELEKEAMIKAQPMLRGIKAVYLPPKSANYFYFKTKIPINYMIPDEPEKESFLFVDDIWQADTNEINKTYRNKKKRKKATLVLPLGERAALIHYSVVEEILQEKENHPLRDRIEKGLNQLRPESPYLSYLSWQQKFIGYSHLQSGF